MKYTPATIAKALVALCTSTIGAATVAAAGTDLSHLTPGQWAAALGAGLIAFGGVFVTPNKSTAPDVAPADQIINGAQTLQDVRDHAQAELERAKQGVSEILGTVPVVGPLAQAAIDAVTLPRR